MIHILERVCSPAGHVLESIAWDDERSSDGEAAFQLGLLALPILPVCAVCGSTSAVLRNVPTRFRTVEEAARSRPGCQVLE